MVDLRTCEKGDMLVSQHGLVLRYVEELTGSNYLDHSVMYPDGSPGTRTHDGYVFRKKRAPEDHDIIKIVKWKEIFEL